MSTATSEDADNFLDVVGDPDYNSRTNGSNMTEEEWIELYDTRLEATIVPCFFSLIFIVGVVGNALLILSFTRHKTLTMAHNALVVNLATGDFIFLLISLPLNSVWYTIPYWPFGRALCKISHFAENLATAVIITSLAVLSVERCLIVTGKRLWKQKKREPIILTGSIWVLSIALAVINLFSSDIIRRDIQGEIYEFCTQYRHDWGKTYGRVHVFCKFVLLFIFPLIIIATAYIIIAVHLLTRAMPSSKRNNLKSKNDMRMKCLTKRKPKIPKSARYANLNSNALKQSPSNNSAENSVHTKHGQQVQQSHQPLRQTKSDNNSSQNHHPTAGPKISKDPRTSLLPETSVTNASMDDHSFTDAGATDTTELHHLNNSVCGSTMEPTSVPTSPLPPPDEETDIDEKPESERHAEEHHPAPPCAPSTTNPRQQPAVKKTPSSGFSQTVRDVASRQGNRNQNQEETMPLNPNSSKESGGSGGAGGGGGGGNTSNTGGSGGKTENAATKRRRLAITVLMLIVAFAACWTPRYVYLLWYHFAPGDFDHFWHVLKITGFCLSFSNSAVNPVVFYILDIKYRLFVHKALCAVCLKKCRWRADVTSHGPPTLGDRDYNATMGLSESKQKLSKQPSGAGGATQV